MTDVPVYRPGKRKRGRPRKDSNLLREHGLFSPINTSNISKTQTPEIKSPRSSHDPRTIENIDVYHRDGTSDGMVGRMIYGVIEGSFDAGYFISVRMSNSNTHFRGVIFHSQKVVPITTTNDIAPNAKMYQRKEIPVPVYNLQSCISPSRKVIMQPSQATKQETLHNFRPSMSQPFSLNDRFTGHSTFVLAEDMMPRINSCSNLGKKMAIRSEAMQMFAYSAPSKDSRNIAESSLNATINSLLGDESINQNRKPHEMVDQHKQNHSNIETHQNFMANTPQSTYETQHHNNEMICSEIDRTSDFIHTGWQSPTSQLQQEVAQRQHSLRKEHQVVNSKHEQSNIFCHHTERNTPYSYYQNQFTFHSQSESQEHQFSGSNMQFVDHVTNNPNLELDLASAMQENSSANDQALYELRNRNLGYHQALVSGNHFLLPPDLSGKQLEFKPSDNTTQQTNLKVKSGVVETEERFQGEGYVETGARSGQEEREDAPFKLELGTTQLDGERRSGMQITSSTGCITNMDFVISEVMPSTISHGHQDNVHGTNESYMRSLKN